MAESYLSSLLGKQEKVLLVTRQHWFVLFRSILVEIVLLLVILAAAIVATTFFLPFWPLIAGVAVLLALIPLITMGRDILDWGNREYIVTNRRVIQIAGIFNKNVIDSSLEKVNDVKMYQSALGRMFDYGDVEILTASEMGANLFRRIGTPVGFKTAMLNAKEQLERGGPPERDGRMDIPLMIEKLDQLRKQGVLSEEEFLRKKSELLSKL